MTITVEPLISILAGILIFIFPKFLNYIIAFYLIFVGIMELIG